MRVCRMTNRARPRAVRAVTFSLKRAFYVARDERDPLPIPRSLPQVREECINGPRPCPFVTCKHHLYLDVHPRTGSIKINFPDMELEEMTESCSLDIADKNEATLEQVGTLMNITRERVRQLERIALIKFNLEFSKINR